MVVISSTVNATDSEKGQSVVVGVVLLLGLSIAVVSLVVLVGSTALSGTEEAARMQHVESAFTQVDAKASQVALGGGAVQTVELGLDSSNQGVLETRPSGRFVVVTDDGTEFVNQTLGTVLYETDEDVVAYQGGGVWRGSDNETVMVSPPEFHYRHGTLTLPMVIASPAEGASPGVTVQSNGSRTNLGPGKVENRIVTVEISGRFYMGWARFFRNRIAGVSVDIDHANRTVEAELAQLEIEGDYSTGLVGGGDVEVDTPMTVHTRIRSAGSVNDTHGTVECDSGTGSDCYTENADIDLVPLDATIERLVNQSEDNDPEANVDGGPATLTAGSYYSEGFNLSDGTLTLDLSSGNVTMFVDGNIGLDNRRIQVVNGEGTDHHAKVYTTGDVAIAGGNAGVAVESDNATRFQLFGTSELHFGMGQANTYGYTGTVYAPRDGPASGSNDAVAEYNLPSATAACPPDTDTCLGQGNGEVKGAIIGGPASVEQATGFRHDDNLTDVQPTLPPGANLPPPITYLHVSVNRVDVVGPTAGGKVISLP